MFINKIPATVRAFGLIGLTCFQCMHALPFEVLSSHMRRVACW